MTIAQDHKDDVPTLMAAGVLTYVAETLLHEAGGHGVVCLAEGHRVLVLAPLWMRCSQADRLLTAAGPAMNVIAAVGCFAVLRLWRGAGPLAGLLLWLGFAFNALVACGYLGVGAATGFGDWPVLFAGVTPAAVWRVPAMFIAIAGYYGCLRVAAGLFIRLTGGGAQAARDLRRRALVSASAAAFVACLAEIAGGRAAAMPLLLALGCTFAVGYSLISMDGIVAGRVAPDAARRRVPRSPWTIAIGLLTATLFATFIGPGLHLS